MFPVQRLLIGTGLCLAAGFVALPSRAADDVLYKPVRAEDLGRTMSRYWATGVTVEDMVISPPGSKRQRIDGKDYLIFETKVIGLTYLEATAKVPPEGLKSGNRYLFTGTVLQESQGWFSRKVVYRFVVSDVANAVPEASDLATQLTATPSESVDTNSADAVVIRNIQELLTGVQSVVAAKARNSDIPIWEMYDIASTNRAFVEQEIARSVSEMIGQVKQNPESILAQFILALAAIQNAKPVSVGEIEEPAPQPAPAPPKPTPPESKKRPSEPKPEAAPPTVPEETKKPEPPKAAPVLRPRLRVTPVESRTEAPVGAESASPEAPVESAPVPEPPSPAPAVEPSAEIAPDPSPSAPDVIDDLNRPVPM